MAGEQTCERLCLKMRSNIKVRARVSMEHSSMQTRFSYEFSTETLLAKSVWNSTTDHFVLEKFQWQALISPFCPTGEGS